MSDDELTCDLSSYTAKRAPFLVPFPLQTAVSSMRAYVERSPAGVPVIPSHQDKGERNKDHTCFGAYDYSVCWLNIAYGQPIGPRTNKKN